MKNKSVYGILLVILLTFVIVFLGFFASKCITRKEKTKAEQLKPMSFH